MIIEDDSTEFGQKLGIILARRDDIAAGRIKLSNYHIGKDDMENYLKVLNAKP
jgi:hypothetical protein